MRFLRSLGALLSLWLLAAAGWAQAPATPPLPTKDLGDLVKAILPHRARRAAADSTQRAAVPDSLAPAPRQPKTTSLVVLPAVAYTLEARLLATLTASVSFQRPEANLSALSTTLTYTQNRQLILALNGPYWTSHNHSLWLADYRLLHYPQNTYGLGSNSHEGDVLGMNYNLLRVHQSYYHRVGGRGPLYAGVGYFLDTRWNIITVDGNGQQLEAIDGYRPGVRGRSTSSGLVVSVLRDSRDNQLRPAAGESYLFLALRATMQALGSDASYRFVQFDTRRYLHAGGKANVLA
ncbi:MAG: hypothetical protein EOO59_11455, partial [Hymenobacter sp.]